MFWYLRLYGLWDEILVFSYLVHLGCMPHPCWITSLSFFSEVCLRLHAFLLSLSSNFLSCAMELFPNSILSWLHMNPIPLFSFVSLCLLRRFSKSDVFLSKFRLMILAFSNFPFRLLISSSFSWQHSYLSLNYFVRHSSTCCDSFKCIFRRSIYFSYPKNVIY